MVDNLIDCLLVLAFVMAITVFIAGALGVAGVL